MLCMSCHKISKSCHSNSRLLVLDFIDPPTDTLAGWMDFDSARELKPFAQAAQEGRVISWLTLLTQVSQFTKFSAQDFTDRRFRQFV